MTEIQTAGTPFADLARGHVVKYFNDHVNKTAKASSEFVMEMDHTFVVKSSFILGNWKCLVSTTVPDGMYYEITHNVAKGETYLDAYKKFDNVCIPD